MRRRLPADRADARPASRGRGGGHPRRDADQRGRDRAETRGRFLDGGLDLLYVAPERASTADFRDLLQRGRIALFAIDEAHCVSEWGHDFRPDYRLLRPLLDSFPDVPASRSPPPPMRIPAPTSSTSSAFRTTG